MSWDDLLNSHFIIIRNTGKQTVVVKSIMLYAIDKKNNEFYELGTRDNAWAIRQEKPYLESLQAMKIAPIYGSSYDVFSYKGHAFDVDDKNKDLIVYIRIKDISGKQWDFPTQFSLKDIDNALEYATTFDL